MKNFTKILTLIAVTSSFSSCSYRPIFDRNDKYNRVGQQKADQDFEFCKEEAKEYLDQYKAKRAAKEAVRKSAIGSVSGAIAGAIWGKSTKSTLMGAAIGAGAGVIIGAVSVAGEDKIKPDQMQQKYISQCLAKDGYSILGWE
jgi:hypothetical protein